MSNKVSNSTFTDALVEKLVMVKDHKYLKIQICVVPMSLCESVV